MDCSVFICAEKCHFHWIDKCFCDMIHIGAIYDTNGEEKFMLISGKIITGILTAAVMAMECQRQTRGIAAESK